MNLSPIVSPLTRDKAKVEVGTEIVYSDIYNYTKYRVTAVSSYSFVAVDEDGNKVSHAFENLQHGWRILDSN